MNKFSLKILFRAYNFIIESVKRILIIFKKSRKMTNDFFNHYIFVRTFQWTSSEMSYNTQKELCLKEREDKLTMANQNTVISKHWTNC